MIPFETLQAELKRTLGVILFALPFSLAAQTTEVLFSSADEVVMDVVFNPCELLPVEDAGLVSGYVATMKGATSLLKEGAPDLPKVDISIAIDASSAYGLEILDAEWTDITGVSILPSKGNLYRNVDPATVPYSYGAAYTQDVFFPDIMGYLRDPFIFGTVRGQTIILHPVLYNPQSQTLRVYSSMQIAVRKLSDNGINPMDDASLPVSAAFEELYATRFANYLQESDRYEHISEIGNMLVIADPAFMAAMEPLVQWKKEKGIPTTLVSTAQTGDTADEIEEYVDSFYDANGLTYLLLVGDAPQVPAIQTSQGNACDHCYAYQNGNDHYPEFFVGRFPAENAGQVEVMVARTLEYEKNPATGVNWFSRAIGSGSAEGPGDDGEYDYEHMNNIKIDLLDYNYTMVWEFYDGSQAASSPTGGETADGAGNPSSSSIAAKVDDGVSLYNYVGHGDHGVLVTGNFNTTAIHGLTNTGRYPFLIAVACCVGDFQNDFGAGECLAEAWLRATDNNGNPAGGIGGCFSSILQSWSPPMEGQDEMNMLIAETADYPIRHSLGGIVVHGCGAMNDAYGAGGDEMTDTWNIHGDPSVVLRTAFPSTLVASHPEALFLGMSEITVTCSVNDAMIGITMDGELLGTGFISNGSATIAFDPLMMVGDLLVTATAYNYIPYQGLVDVVPAEGPFVIEDSVFANDENGNDNGSLEYGENVLLDVALSNVGVDLAGNVVATLTTSDPYITITDNYHNYGDIEASEVIMMEGAYTFDVAVNVPDGHSALFTLHIEDEGGNTWNFNFNLVLNAPSLDTAVEILVEETTGNGNGRLDSGETVELHIPTYNVGHADSPAATGTLSTSSPYFSISNNGYALGVIEIDGQEVAIFEAIIAAEVPSGTVAVFDYEVAAGAYSASRSYEEPVNLIIDDFESNDFNTYAWALSGDANWFTSSFEPFNGEVCSQSGAMGDNAACTMEITVEVLAAGEISFARRVSSEADWDWLEFYIDGVLMDSWSGEVAWSTVSFGVGTGEHTFTWKYIKDFWCCTGGMDAAWVDDVILPPFDNGSVVSVSTEETSTWTLFPNPASDFIRLTSETGDALLGWTVYSSTGARVKASSKVTVETTVNVEDLTEGVYLIEFETESGRFTRPFVKSSR